MTTNRGEKACTHEVADNASPCVIGFHFAAVQLPKNKGKGRVGRERGTDMTPKARLPVGSSRSASIPTEIL
jgi:hypothetical protein